MNKEQRGVIAGVATAVLLSITLFFAAVIFCQSNMAAEEVATAFRLKLLAGCFLGLSLPLVIAIARLAQHRFFTPEDLNGSALTQGTARAKLLQALLQNTLEQTVFALVIYFACAFLFPPHFLPLIPTATGMFFVGRILFFVRYAGGASARAFGFAFTFYPTIFLGAIAAYCLLSMAV
ncbi:MAG: MAPEG family protein [Vibrionaceae bacterium]